MPRKAPDGKGVTEHRITFGNKEREFISAIREQEKTNAIIKGVGSIIPGLGIVAVAGGIGVAAYALYRWVGMSGNPVDAIVNAGTTIGETILGTTVEEQVAQSLDPLQNEYTLVIQRCDEMMAVQTAIIANPNSTANQKAQAELEITRIQRVCRKKVKSVLAKLKRIQENPEYVATAGTWLGPDVVKY